MKLPSILFSILFIALAFISSADDWPRWRGSNFDGVANPSTHPFSGKFDLKIRWKHPLGTGYSGVVVSDGKAITMFSDGKSDYLIALASNDGKEIWRLTLGEAFPPRDGSSGGPVSTPAIDHGVVFALGPRGNLVAVQLVNGKRIWNQDLAELSAAAPHWGFTTSPLVIGDAVVVFTGGTPNHAVTAFNRTNGEIVWQSVSDEFSYQSPILFKWNQSNFIVGGGDKTLFAIDPKDGHEVWKYEHGGEGFYGQIINPVRIGNDSLLLTNKPEETVLLKIGSKIEPAWTTRELKLNYATPVTQRNLIFGYSGRFFSAIDAATGQLRWRSRHPGDGFPIIVDDHLVVMTKRGTLVVAEASADLYQEKASIDVFDRLVWTPPSFAEGRIFVRDSYEDIAAVDIVPSPNNIPAAATATVTENSSFANWVSETEKAPNAAERVKNFLAEHPVSPIFEAERYAHVIYVGPEKEVVLRGDPFEVGQEVTMKQVAGTDLHYTTLELDKDTRVTYQLTRNFEDPIADPRNPATSTSLNYPGAVSILLMPKAAPVPQTPSANLRGKIVELELESPKVKAEHLTWGGKRSIKVYLPPGYENETAQRYPSVYVLLGDEMIKDVKLPELIDSAIGDTLPPCLVVFVASTSAYELARTFREPHSKMIANQLIPMIDKQFRTITDRVSRVILGVDEGGFAAVEIGLRYPEIFGGVIAHSIFPLTGGDKELLALVDASVNKGQRFYVDWGRYDPRRKSDGLDVPGFTRAVHDHLLAKGQNVSGQEWNEGSALAFLGSRSILGLQSIIKSNQN
jgi:outer membrane protein assembly factor BamB/enterochelin esterase-like enzyme